MSASITGKAPLGCLVAPPRPLEELWPNATLQGCNHDPTRLPPQQYCQRCSSFNESDCARYWVPVGNCIWLRDTCQPDPQCVHLATAPTGTSYIFFKFHKVGSSTVAATLDMTLVGTSGDPYTACPDHAYLTLKDPLKASRYRYCSLCATHNNTLPLLAAFKPAAVLASPATTQLAAIFATTPGAAVMDSTCPFRPSMRNRLYTGTVIRNPVDRVISKYFFLRTYCAQEARKLGLRGCSAFELDIVRWLFADPEALKERKLLHMSPWQISHEVLGYLSSGGATSASSLKEAERALDAMTVVGITERMDETMVLFSEGWRLPLPAVRSAYTSLLQNPNKLPINESTRAAILAHPGVALETRLYRHAYRRFERDVVRVPQMASKLAFLRSGGSVTCRLRTGHWPKLTGSGALNCTRSRNSEDTG